MQVYEFGHANKRQLRVTGVFHRLQDRKGAPARKLRSYRAKGNLGHNHQEEWDDRSSRSLGTHA